MNALNYRVEDGIGYLVIDVPGQKVNTLSKEVMLELQQKLTEIEQKTSVKALVIISAKKDNFIAGADVKEFVRIHDVESAEAMANLGQGVLNQLSAFKVPTIAVIDGSCMGGGLELALACSYRIVTDEEKTTLALPEVNLGIIPGWGGTQRLPRIVGLIQGLDMILTGKSVPGFKAYKIGLADAIFPRIFLKDKIKEFVQELNDGKVKSIQKRRGSSGLKSLILEKNPIGRSIVFRQTEKQVLDKTKGFYPAPLAALNVVKNTFGMGLKDGLKLEAKTISNLFDSPISHNLIHIFLSSQEVKKDPGRIVEAKPREINSAAVLGAGIMGGAIAWLFSKENILVRLKDINWEAIGKGLASARCIYGQLVKIKKLKASDVSLKMAHISGTTDYSGFKNVDLVLEAIVEDLKIKQEVLKEVERKVKSQTIIASNTSALSISEMGRVLDHPERFIGMHFFNPVNRMPLVEVIPGEKTNTETIATVLALLKKLGKTAIVVADQPGFLVNRILLPYLNEGGKLIEDGVDFERVDHLLTGFGMPMGPFQLLDEVGLDVAFKAAKTLEHAFGERAKVSPIIQKMVEHGLNGKKTGKGFYIEKKGKRKRNSKVDKILGISSDNKNISNQEIINRCILGMVNEASRCIEDKVVSNADLLDMAMILGAGFPPFRGGVLRYADQVGIDKVVENLNHLTNKIGNRFTPSPLLLKMQANKMKFTGI